MAKQNRLVRAETDMKTRFKLYKAGKLWLQAGMGLLIFGAASLIGGSPVQADTVVPPEAAAQTAPADSTNTHENAVVLGQKQATSAPVEQTKPAAKTPSPSQTPVKAAPAVQASASKTAAAAPADQKKANEQVTNLGDATAAQVKTAQKTAGQTYAKTGVTQKVTAQSAAANDSDTVDITRTINYTLAAGYNKPDNWPVLPSVTQHSKFKKVGTDPVSGKPTYILWEDGSPAISPEISGYTADKDEYFAPSNDPGFPSDPNHPITEQELPKSSTITVTYTPNRQSVPVYFTDDGGILQTSRPITSKPLTINGRTDQTVSYDVTNVIPANYKLVDATTAKGNYTFTADKISTVLIPVEPIKTTKTLKQTRTIQAKAALGVDSKALDDYNTELKNNSQTITWTIEHNWVTTQYTATPDSAQFNAVTVHSVSDGKGGAYLPAQTSVPARNVQAITYYGTDPAEQLGDLTREVIYHRAELPNTVIQKRAQVPTDKIPVTTKDKYYDFTQTGEVGALQQVRNQVPTEAPSAHDYTVNIQTPDGQVLKTVTFIGNTGDAIAIKTDLSSEYKLVSGTDVNVTIPNDQDPNKPIIVLATATAPAGDTGSGNPLPATGTDSSNTTSTGNTNTTQSGNPLPATGTDSSNTTSTGNTNTAPNGSPLPATGVDSDSTASTGSQNEASSNRQSVGSSSYLAVRNGGQTSGTAVSQGQVAAAAKAQANADSAKALPATGDHVSVGLMIAGFLAMLLLGSADLRRKQREH